MDIIYEENKYDSRRVKMLRLEADTFEEERILTNLLRACTSNKTIKLTYSVSDSTNKTLKFTLRKKDEA